MCWLIQYSKVGIIRPVQFQHINFFVVCFHLRNGNFNFHTYTTLSKSYPALPILPTLSPLLKTRAEHSFSFHMTQITFNHHPITSVWCFHFSFLILSWLLELQSCLLCVLIFFKKRFTLLLCIGDKLKCWMCVEGYSINRNNLIHQWESLN